jgi:hypothetical protein
MPDSSSGASGRRRRAPAPLRCLVVLTALAVLAGVGAAASPQPAGRSAAAGARPTGMATGASVLWEDDADLARDLDVVAGSGATWVRFDFDWASAEPAAGSFDWSHIDRVVDSARSRGLTVLALPAYTPTWARPPGTTAMHPPSDPADFARFVAAAAVRYAGRGVGAWEVWNEPNLAHFWQPGPDPAAYTRLLTLASRAVRQVDPDAVVLTGGLSPARDDPHGGQMSPVTFLRGVYAAGGAGQFDAVGMHPYCYPARPSDARTAAWNTFYRLPAVHDVMAEHGDGAKEVWLTEFGAPTGSAPGAVGEAEQEAVLRDAFATLARWPWAGPLLWYSHRDTGTDRADREQNFGLLRHDFTAKPALRAFAELS